MTKYAKQILTVVLSLMMITTMIPSAAFFDYAVAETVGQEEINPGDVDEMTSSDTNYEDVSFEDADTWTDDPPIRTGEISQEEPEKTLSEEEIKAQWAEKLGIDSDQVSLAYDENGQLQVSVKGDKNSDSDKYIKDGENGENQEASDSKEVAVMSLDNSYSYSEEILGSITSYEADGSYEAAVLSGETVTPENTFSDAVSAVNGGSADTIVLLKDIKSQSVSLSSPAVIDLNGHSIIQVGSDNGEESVYKTNSTLISSTKDLTITDLSVCEEYPAGKGKITGHGYRVVAVTGDAGSPAVFTLNGGTVEFYGPGYKNGTKIYAMSLYFADCNVVINKGIISVKSAATYNYGIYFKNASQNAGVVIGDGSNDEKEILFSLKPYDAAGDSALGWESSSSALCRIINFYSGESITINGGSFEVVNEYNDKYLLEGTVSNDKFALNGGYFASVLKSDAVSNNLGSDSYLLYYDSNVGKTLKDGRMLIYSPGKIETLHDNGELRESEYSYVPDMGAYTITVRDNDKKYILPSTDNSNEWKYEYDTENEKVLVLTSLKNFDNITKAGYTLIGFKINTDSKNQASDISGMTLTVPAGASGNIELTPLWKGNEYSVTFDNNYDGAAASSEINQTYGAKYILPENPIRENYAFKGWNTKADGTGTKITKESDVKNTDDYSVSGGKAVLYATWTIIEGSKVTRVKVKSSSVEASSLDGYLCYDDENDWYYFDNVQDGLYFISGVTSGNADDNVIELLRDATISKFNGGRNIITSSSACGTTTANIGFTFRSCSDPEIINEGQSGEEENKIFTLTNALKTNANIFEIRGAGDNVIIENINFAGGDTWRGKFAKIGAYDNDDLSKAVHLTLKNVKFSDIYGTWQSGVICVGEDDEYAVLDIEDDVTFNNCSCGDEAGGGAIRLYNRSELSVHSSANLVIKNCKAAKGGAIQAGSGAEISIESGATLDITGNTKENGTAKDNINLENGAVLTVEGNFNGSIGISGITAKRTVFANIGNNTTLQENQITNDSDNTCYAFISGTNIIWACDDSKVTFNANNGKFSDGSATFAVEKIKYNSTIEEPGKKPLREHYSFDGWYKEADCINKWNFENDKVTNNLTLYAKWRKVEAAIKIKADYQFESGAVNFDGEYTYFNDLSDAVRAIPTSVTGFVDKNTIILLEDIIVSGRKSGEASVTGGYTNFAIGISKSIKIKSENSSDVKKIIFDIKTTDDKNPLYRGGLYVQSSSGKLYLEDVNLTTTEADTKTSSLIGVARGGYLTLGKGAKLSDLKGDNHDAVYLIGTYGNGTVEMLSGSSIENVEHYGINGEADTTIKVKGGTIKDCGTAIVASNLEIQGDAAIIDNKVNIAAKDESQFADNFMMTGNLTGKVGISFNVGGTGYGKKFGISSGSYSGAENFINDSDNNYHGYLNSNQLVWSSDEYTVTLDMNLPAGVAEEIASKTVTVRYGGNIVLDVNTLPALSEYTFTGYYDAKDGGTKYVNADGTSALAWNKFSDDKKGTLYAHWTSVEAEVISKDGSRETLYSTFAAACNAAKSGETIKLLKNVKSRGVTINVPVTIDLDGWTLTQVGTDGKEESAYKQNIVFIDAKSDLTIMDSSLNEEYPAGKGKIIGNGYITVRVSGTTDKYAKFNLDGGTVDFHGPGCMINSYPYAISVYVQNADANINRGIISVESAALWSYGMYVKNSGILIGDGIDDEKEILFSIKPYYADVEGELGWGKRWNSNYMGYCRDINFISGDVIVNGGTFTAVSDYRNKYFFTGSEDSKQLVLNGGYYGVGVDSDVLTNNLTENAYFLSYDSNINSTLKDGQMLISSKGTVETLQEDGKVGSSEYNYIPGRGAYTISVRDSENRYITASTDPANKWQYDFSADSDTVKNLPSLNNYADIAKVGYTLTGFRITANTKGKASSLSDDFALTIPAGGYGNIELAPIFTVNEYDLTFNYNYSGAPASEVVKQKYGTKYLIPGVNPTREHFDFAGWYTKASGGTRVTADNVFDLTENQTLYARWGSTKYKITLNTTGGTINASGWTPSELSGNAQFTGEQIDGASLTLPSGSEVTRSGYRFIGWFTDETDDLTAVATSTDLALSLEKKAVKSISDKSTGEKTYYAGWVLDPEYKVNQKNYWKVSVAKEVSGLPSVLDGKTYYDGAGNTAWLNAYNEADSEHQIDIYVDELYTCPDITNHTLIKPAIEKSVTIDFHNHRLRDLSIARIDEDGKGTVIVKNLLFGCMDCESGSNINYHTGNVILENCTCDKKVYSQYGRGIWLCSHDVTIIGGYYNTVFGNDNHDASIVVKAENPSDVSTYPVFDGATFSGFNGKASDFYTIYQGMFIENPADFQLADGVKISYNYDRDRQRYYYGVHSDVAGALVKIKNTNAQNEVYYYSWNEAMKIVKEGAIITLLSDIVLNNTQEFAFDVTIDGNGNSLTSTVDNTKCTLKIENSKALTIKNIEIDSIDLKSTGILNIQGELTGSDNIRINTYDTPDYNGKIGITTESEETANRLVHSGGLFSGTVSEGNLVWTSKTLVVLLDPNSENGELTNDRLELHYGEKPDLAANQKPTRPGYRFAGYYDAKSGGTQYYDANGTCLMGWYSQVSNPVLYAHWTEMTGFLRIKTTTTSAAGSTGHDGTYLYFNNFQNAIDFIPSGGKATDVNHIIEAVKNNNITDPSRGGHIYVMDGNKKITIRSADINHPVTITMLTNAGLPRGLIEVTNSSELIIDHIIFDGGFTGSNYTQYGTARRMFLVQNSSSMTMNEGAVIQNMVSLYSGGAIILNGYSGAISTAINHLYMYPGSKITNVVGYNYSENTGLVIRVDGQSNFYMYGGEIVNNRIVSANGTSTTGMVYVSNKSHMEVRGDAQINNNTYNGKAFNLFVADKNNFSLVGDLTPTANICLTLTNASGFGDAFGLSSKEYRNINGFKNDKNNSFYGKYQNGTLVWESPEYTIKFMNGSTQMGTVKVHAGQSITIPNNLIPEKSGNICEYYDKESGGTKYFNANGTAAKAWDKTDATTTLYAHFTQIGNYETRVTSTSLLSGAALFDGTYSYFDDGKFTTAIVSAKSGQTVELLKDITFNQQITRITSGITIDLCGHQINTHMVSGSWSGGNAFDFSGMSGKTTLTVKNGTIKFRHKMACSMYLGCEVYSYDVNYLSDSDNCDSKFAYGNGTVVHLYGGSFQGNMHLGGTDGGKVIIEEYENEFLLKNDRGFGGDNIVLKDGKYVLGSQNTVSTLSGKKADGYTVSSINEVIDGIRYTGEVSINGGFITYINVENSNNSINPTTYEKAAGFTVQEISKAGSTFIGWTYPGQTTPAKTVVIAPNTKSGSITFTANWELKTTNITLNANGGESGAKTSVTATYGSAVPKLQLNELPHKEGRGFGGYFDQPEGGNKYYDASGNSVKSWDKTDTDATLYAHWVDVADNYDACIRSFADDNATYYDGNDSYYATLAEALMSASDGATVILLRDVKMTDKVSESSWRFGTENVTIELNGHFLEGAGTRTFEIPNYFTLTLQDSGRNSEHQNYGGYVFAYTGGSAGCVVDGSVDTKFISIDVDYYKPTGWSGKSEWHTLMTNSRASGNKGELVIEGGLIDGVISGAGDYYKGGTNKVNIDVTLKNSEHKKLYINVPSVYNTNGKVTALGGYIKGVPADLILESGHILTNVSAPAPTRTFKQYNSSNGTFEDKTMENTYATDYLHEVIDGYKVTFNANGGNWVSGYTAPNQYALDGGLARTSGSANTTFDMSLPASENISREHCVFDGWYTKNGLTRDASGEIDWGSKIVNSDSFAGADTEVYAKWNGDEFEAKFNSNGGSFASNTDLTLNQSYSSLYNLPETNPERKGYSFGGWFTENGENDEWGTQVTKDTCYLVAGNTELYAYWGVAAYSVELNANGGVIETGRDVTSYKYGTTVVLPDENSITKNGYNFLGWYTKDGTTLDEENEPDWGDRITEITETDTDAKIFYAKWEISFDSFVAKISGIRSGGEFISTEGYTYYLSLPAAYNGSESGDVIVILKDITLTSQITINKEVTIKSEDDEPVKTIKADGTFRHFQVNNGGILKTYNIILDGCSKWLSPSNNSDYSKIGGSVRIEKGAKYEMNDGTKIINAGVWNSSNNIDCGGAIGIIGGEFVMNGGEITGCYSQWGSSIWMNEAGSICRLYGGSIHDNLGGVSQSVARFDSAGSTCKVFIHGDIQIYKTDASGNHIAGECILLKDNNSIIVDGDLGENAEVYVGGSYTALGNAFGRSIEVDEEGIESNYIKWANLDKITVGKAGYIAEAFVTNEGTRNIRWRGREYDMILHTYGKAEDQTVVNASIKETGSTWIKTEPGVYTGKYRYAETEQPFPELTNIPVGYTIAGWTDVEGDTSNLVPNIPSKVYNDVEYWAAYKFATYNITYNTNGGALRWGENEPVLEYSYGDTVVLPDSEMITKQGYEFSGWYTKDGTDGDWGSPVSIISDSEAEDKVFYAKWRVDNSDSNWLAKVNHAVNGNEDTITEDSVTWTYFDDLQDALQAAGTEESVVVMLRDAVIENGVTVASGQNIILDMNGKVISGSGDSSHVKASAITNNGNLVITSSDVDDVNGLPVNGIITKYDGTKLGNYYVGGGVNNNGTLTLENITIKDCGASTSSTTGGTDGAGIFNVGKAYMMTGAVIENCKAGSNKSYRGGVAVYNTNNGEFRMQGGEIRNCNSTMYGGAIYNGGSDYFTNSFNSHAYLEYGVIENCEGQRGGAICNANRVYDGNWQYGNLEIGVSDNADLANGAMIIRDCLTSGKMDGALIWNDANLTLNSSAVLISDKDQPLNLYYQPGNRDTERCDFFVNGGWFSKKLVPESNGLIIFGHTEKMTLASGFTASEDMSKVPDYTVPNEAAPYTITDKYSVTFDANGGTFENEPFGFEILYGETVSDVKASVEIPVKENAEFLGFYDSISGGTKYFEADGTAVANLTWITDKKVNATLYAKWESNEYNVRYNAGNGKFASGTNVVTVPQVKTEEDEWKYILPGENPVLEGYEFKGWFTKDGRTDWGEEVNEETDFPAAENVTEVFAKWDIVTYYTTFDANGGIFGKEEGGESRSEEKNSQIKGHKYSLPYKDPTNDGLDFVGWFTKDGKTVNEEGEPDYGEQITSSDIFDADGDTTLYARYTDRVYNVKFDTNYPTKDNDGTVSHTEKYTYNSVITGYESYNVPTANGYTFKGYSLTKQTSLTYVDDIDLVFEYSEEGLAPVYKNDASINCFDESGKIWRYIDLDNDDVTLYAVWISNTYNIKIGNEVKATYRTPSEKSGIDVKIDSKDSSSYDLWKLDNNSLSKGITSRYESKYSKFVVEIPAYTYGDIRISAGTYKVRYMLSDSEKINGDKPSELDVAYGEKIKLLGIDDITSSGNTLEGWFIGEEKLLAIDTDYQPDCQPGQEVDLMELSGSNDDEIRLYPCWAAQQYNVTFNAGEGKFASNTNTTVIAEFYDRYYELPENPISENRVFEGWFTEGEPDYGTQITGETIFSGTDNSTVLYARYRDASGFVRVKTDKTEAEGSTGYDGIYLYFDNLQKAIDFIPSNGEATDDNHIIQVLKDNDIKDPAVSGHIYLMNGKKITIRSADINSPATVKMLTNGALSRGLIEITGESELIIDHIIFDGGFTGSNYTENGTTRRMFLAQNGSKITMNDGAVIQNMVSDLSGGAIILNGGLGESSTAINSLYMNSGSKITNIVGYNIGEDLGLALRVDSKSNFCMYGGEISGCRIQSVAAGKSMSTGTVYVSNASNMEVRGDAVINGNTDKNGNPYNLLVEEKENFKLAGDLTPDSDVHVRLRNETGFGEPFGEYPAEDDHDWSKANIDRFVNDADDIYTGSYKEGNLVWQSPSYTVTLHAENGKYLNDDDSFDIQIHFGEKLDKAEMPIYTGDGLWTFAGYYDDESCEGNMYFDESGKAVKVFEFTSGTDFYAKWTEVEGAVARIRFDYSEKSGSLGYDGVYTYFASIQDAIDATPETDESLIETGSSKVKDTAEALDDDKYIIEILDDLTLEDATPVIMVENHNVTVKSGKDEPVTLKASNGTDFNDVNYFGIHGVVFAGEKGILRLENIIIDASDNDSNVAIASADNGKLILGSGVILTGSTACTLEQLVYVDGGTLELESGSSITGNIPVSGGKTVVLMNGGVLILSGDACIYDNKDENDKQSNVFIDQDSMIKVKTGFAGKVGISGDEELLDFADKIGETVTADGESLVLAKGIIINDANSELFGAVSENDIIWDIDEAALMRDGTEFMRGTFESMLEEASDNDTIMLLKDMEYTDNEGVISKDDVTADIAFDLNGHKLTVYSINLSDKGRVIDLKGGTGSLIAESAENGVILPNHTEDMSNAGYLPIKDNEGAYHFFNVKAGNGNDITNHPNVIYLMTRLSGDDSTNAAEAIRNNVNNSISLSMKVVMNSNEEEAVKIKIKNDNGEEIEEEVGEELWFNLTSYIDIYANSNGNIFPSVNFTNTATISGYTLSFESEWKSDTGFILRKTSSVTLSKLQ